MSKNNYDRSDALTLIDTQLGAYDDEKTPDKLEFLKLFLDAWYQSKLKRDVLKTIRNHDNAVTELKRSVDRATALRNPTLWSAEFPGIYIADDLYRGTSWVPDDFRGSIEDSLNTIITKPIGRKLVEDISDACTRSESKRVVIQYSGTFSSCAALEPVTPENRKKLNRVSPVDEVWDPAELMQNPALMVQFTGDEHEGKRDYINGAGTGAVVNLRHEDKGLDGRPTYIALAHELVHAYHFVTGNCYRAAWGGLVKGGNTGIMEEEMRTVGFGAYAGEVPSENAIRAEHRIPLRPNYTPDMPFTNVTATVFARG
ncbi:MAG: M91 family zinc metallopeptidase [Pseudomonadota bacterium]